ncbi:WAT1-related protein At5g07050 [Cryptomeria japonica]|uniref:WAT1-related protein At5g07050 n=1 Tax=Cryptomeria japonica TaxID=3369 RepID=UPI0025AD7ABD|nr:WAT1-related protein At5g07050 [Cryptomeria japonica]
MLYIFVFIVQTAYAGLIMISKAALGTGLSCFVLVFYRHVIATVFLGPLAYFLERKSRPSITFYSFRMIFLLALCGTAIQQNLFFEGLKYTSPTFGSALGNAIPAMTFVMAVLFRLEEVKIKTRKGQAKVLGTLICTIGALVMTVYKGSVIPKLWSPPIHIKHNHNKIHEDWTKGSILMMTSYFGVCIWLILQAKIVKYYPAPMSLIALMCFVGSLQSAVAGFIFERNLDAWALGWNLQLLTVVYCGIAISVVANCMQMWYISKKGPVFAAMFSPVGLVIVAILSPAVLDETLHLGSIGGGILVVIGLYTVLWGKSRDMKDISNLLPVENRPEAISNEVQQGSMQSKEISNSKGNAGRI